MQGIGRRNVSRSQRAEDQRPEKGGHAKDIIEKTRRVGTEQSGFVLHFHGTADHVIEAGIIGVEAGKTEQQQQCPEEQK